MDSRDCVKRTIEEVEALSGCPVQVIQDSSIKNMAVLDVARGSVRLHRIRIHPKFSEEADYLTCFQCGFILRKFAVPPEQRVDLMPAPTGLRDVQKMVTEHYANKPIPADVIQGLATQLLNGLTSQLISIPESMRVDSWVTESFPHLVDKQKKMVSRQIQDALDTLNPEVRKIAPEKVVKSTLTMNVAYALFWSRRWDDRLLSLPYRSINLQVAGRHLLEIYDSTPSDPSHDRSLVDAWARTLDLTSYFSWVPYRLDEP
jgi:hypothetical protein